MRFAESGRNVQVDQAESISQDVLASLQCPVENRQSLDQIASIRLDLFLIAPAARPVPIGAINLGLRPYCPLICRGAILDAARPKRVAIFFAERGIDRHRLPKDEAAVVENGNVAVGVDRVEQGTVIHVVPWRSEEGHMIVVELQLLEKDERACGARL